MWNCRFFITYKTSEIKVYDGRLKHRTSERHLLLIPPYQMLLLQWIMAVRNIIWVVKQTNEKAVANEQSLMRATLNLARPVTQHLP